MAGITRESQLWPIIANALKKRYRWSNSWTASSGQRLGWLRAGGGKGQPDVVGVAMSASGPLIHFVEAKLVGAMPRHKVREAISQLGDWHGYANILWVAFTKDDWGKLDQRDHDRFDSELKRDGFGLILVDGRSAEIVLEPRSNRAVVQTSQEELLEAFSIPAGERKVPEFDLSQRNALAAERALVWCYDIFVNEAREISGSRKRIPNPDYDDDHLRQFGWDGWYSRNGTCAITADPLGGLIGNGIPAILVWRSYRDLKSVFGSRHYPFPGAYLWALHEKHGGLTIHRVAEIDQKKLMTEGFTDSPWVIWQLPISGRSRVDIRSELKKVWLNVSQLGG